MCARKSKFFSRSIGVILLLSLVVLCPLFSLTEEETASLNLILENLETSYKNMKDYLSKQEEKISLLGNSYQMQSLNLDELETRNGLLDSGLKQTQEQLKKLESSIQILQEQPKALEQELTSLENSFKKNQREIKLYKGLAIGGVTIAVGVSIGFLLYLFVK